MKKLIPYVLSYLIITTGTLFYPLLYAYIVNRLHPSIVVPLPHNSVMVVLNPGISRAELDAKLQQVGLHEFNPAIDMMTPRPRPLFAHPVYHYVFDAVEYSAFVGLVILFRRWLAAADTVSS